MVFISLVRDDGGWSKGREKNRKEHSGSVSLRNGALEDRIGHKSVKERKTRLHSRDVFGLIMFEVPLRVQLEMVSRWLVHGLEIWGDFSG